MRMHMNRGYLLMLTNEVYSFVRDDKIVRYDRYKGVLRETATIRAGTHVGRGDALERIWLKEMEVLGDDEWASFHREIDQALRFRREYTSAGLPCHVTEVRLCESIEAGRDAEKSTGFLGFDIADLAIQDSQLLISDGFGLPDRAEFSGWTDICALVDAFVKSNLNSDGLMSDYSSAAITRDAVAAVQKLIPRLFLDVKYRVLAILEVATISQFQGV
jgi:hypothetical protein